MRHRNSRSDLITEDFCKYMAEYVEKWGDSIDSAVELALRDLKITRDEAVVTVLEQPSSGFLGLFGRKLAKVRVEKKAEEEKKSGIREASVKDGGQTSASAERMSPERSVPEKMSAAEAEGGIEIRDRGAKKSSGRAKKESSPKGESVSEFSSATEHTSEQTEKTVVSGAENARESREGGKKRHRSSQMHTKFTITAEDTDAVPADDAPGVNFIREIAGNMDLNIEVKGYLKDDTLYVSLEGKDVGSMIGKRGQTLDAVQYLASIVQNRNCESHVRVIINAEKYREKREKTLQLLAKRLADKCIKSGRSVRLEPMNPYERKVIHSALQSNPKVTTRSEGVEPNRRVVIELKR